MATAPMTVAAIPYTIQIPSMTTTAQNRTEMPLLLQAVDALVLSQVSADFTSTGAIRERLQLMGHPLRPNDVRASLWRLQSKPHPRIAMARRGVALWWRQVANAEAK